jgi:hypothetical protein
MRTSLLATLTLAMLCEVGFATEIPIVGIDPIIWRESGFSWGAFAEVDAVTASDDGIVVDVEASEPDGTTNGGFGVGTGELNIDFDAYQMEVRVRPLSENVASTFRVIINEVDTPATGESYQYHFNLSDLEEDEWTTLSVPLSSPSVVWTEGGDSVPEDGFAEFQLMTLWDRSEPLNIEVSGVYLAPIDPEPDGVVFELNANNSTRGFVSGGFQGAVINDGNTISIETDSFGSFGMTWFETDFSAEGHGLVVRARLGEDNEAQAFQVVLADNDGFEAGGDVFADQWIFEFSTDNFTENEFTDVRQALSDPGPVELGFGEYLDGDEEMNFGLFQIAFQSLFDTFHLLDIDIESIRIVEHGGLLAGDADQDMDFDQLDLVKVQIAAKYLTGQPATWGEGDWDGAPGGTVGSPPLGNGVFDQLDIVAALGAGTYLAGPYAAILPGDVINDDQTSIVYHANTGELSVDAPAETGLTSISIDSAAGTFTGDAAENLGGSSDNDSDGNIFKATFGSSFGSLSLGKVAQAGLSEHFVSNDLSVVGSLAGGGDLGNVGLVYVPEPASALLLAFGLAVGMLRFGRIER